MRISKIKDGTEYRMDEQFENLIIFFNFDSFPELLLFTDLENDRIFEIYQFELKKFTNFQNLKIWEIKKIDFTIWKIDIFNLKNY